MSQFGERVPGDLTNSIVSTFFYDKLRQFGGGIKGPGINVPLHLARIRNKNKLNIEQSKIRSIEVRLPLENILSNISHQ